MALNETGFNDIPWQELYPLIDKYCLSKGLGAGQNQSINYRSIDVPWDAWFLEWKQGP